MWYAGEVALAGSRLVGLGGDGWCVRSLRTQQCAHVDANFVLGWLGFCLVGLSDFFWFCMPWLFGRGVLEPIRFSSESLILAQDERWRRA
jgi:hypothetical protein